jgi:hypothetical protein
MTELKRNKLIDKLRKLLALADPTRGATEAEAASAMAKVQSLLAEHNLSLSDLETGPQGPRIREDKELRTDSRPWRRALAISVARLYFCDHFYSFHKEWTNKRSCGYIRYDVHHFIGEEHNVLVAKMMFLYLIGTIDALATSGSMKLAPKDRTPYVTSFQHSCSARLCVRIMQLIEDARKGRTKDESGRNLPVLASLYDQAAAANKAFLDQSTPGLKEVVNKRSKINSALGVVEGHAAGNTISLNNNQVGSGTKTHLLR